MILNKKFRRVIGGRFFFNCLGLSRLGKHEILIPSLCRMASSDFKIIQLIARTTKCLISFPNCIKTFSHPSQEPGKELELN